MNSKCNFTLRRVTAVYIVTCIVLKDIKQLSYHFPGKVFPMYHLAVLNAKWRLNYHDNDEREKNRIYALVMISTMILNKNLYIRMTNVKWFRNWGGF